MTIQELTKCPVTEILVRDTACFECKFWKKWTGRDSQHECKYEELMKYAVNTSWKQYTQYVEAAK